MSLQRKLVISFCIFLTVLFGTMAIILYSYGTREIEEGAQANLEVLGDKMIQQFDNLVRPMDFITVNLIATGDFINSMSALTNVPRGTPRNDVFINQSTRNVQSVLSGNDSINRNFYSINVFNEKGDIFSSRILQPYTRVPADEILEGLEWISHADELRGRILLVTPHTDPWDESRETEVFSLVRAIHGSGGRVGYIEVQHLISELDKIFNVPDSVDLKAVLLSNDGSIFYQNGFDSADHAAEFLTGTRDREYLSYRQYADFTGFSLFLYQDRQSLLQPLTNILSLSAVMMVMLLTISVMFAIILHGQLIKPVRILRKQMEGVKLETLRDTLPTVTSSNDLVALENTFALMRERLGEAITRELRSQALQMQANYDALQLQTNPHFLYNVLNVISRKGMESEDDEICEICSDLASMLRYSTSTLQRTATIGEELNHVEAYVALMQKRYVGRIQFSVSADNAVLSCEIPKITLQQLVENAIKHSFDAGYKEIEIKAQCYKKEYGWGIRIVDNGPGFSEQILNRLKADIPELRDKLLNQHTEFAIGGMGLLNTFARLWLFFGDCIELVPGNNEEGGAYVTIEFQEGGPPDDKSDGSRG